MAGLEAVGARRKLWTWKFILMMLINFANGMAGYMTVPLVSKYAVSIGANLTVASSISGILPLVAMVVCPVAGVLSDRINRKKLLLATNIGYSVFLCLHAFAGGLGVLAVLRAGTGVFFAVSSVLTVACASSYIPKERMGEGRSFRRRARPWEFSCATVSVMARRLPGRAQRFWRRWPLPQRCPMKEKKQGLESPCSLKISLPGSLWDLCC